MREFISNYDEACAKLNRSNELPDVSMYGEKKQARVIADHKMETILEWNNDGWEADIANIMQRKWYPYFDVIKDGESPGGFRLSFVGSVNDSGVSLIAVHHACKNQELSEFTGRNCSDLYKDLRR